MKHVMIQSPIIGDAHELKMGKINKENKQGSHMSSFRNKLMHQSYTEKGKGTPKIENAHGKINSTKTNKWLLLSKPKQQVDAQKKKKKLKMKIKSPVEVRKHGTILVKPGRPSSSKKLLFFELPSLENDLIFRSIVCLLQLPSSLSFFLRLLTGSLSSSLKFLPLCFQSVSSQIVPL